MKLFNPDNAEMVDDAEEASDLEGFLGRVDTSVKEMRVRVIEEAFRELTKVAKRERGQLLAEATKTFCAEMEKVGDKICDRVCGDVGKVSESVAAVAATSTTLADEAAKQAKRANNRMDALNAKTKDIEEAMKDMAERAKAVPAPMPEAPDDSEDEADDATGETLKSILAAVEALKTAAPPARPTWNFKVVRDDYARISNIVATPST